MRRCLLVTLLTFDSLQHANLKLEAGALTEVEHAAAGLAPSLDDIDLGVAGSRNTESDL